MDAEHFRHHVRHKVAMRELDPEIAERMLAYPLNPAADIDYQRVLRAATFIPPPLTCYHTAPMSARAAIWLDGLTIGLGQNWGEKMAGQPPGVYLTPTPDVRGMWAHSSDWDVWAVTMLDRVWEHDTLNPGCYRVGPVPPEHLSLYGYTINGHFTRRAVRPHRQPPEPLASKP